MLLGPRRTRGRKRLVLDRRLCQQRAVVADDNRARSARADVDAENWNESASARAVV
jgi:hypothetical protein